MERGAFDPGWAGSSDSWKHAPGPGGRRDGPRDESLRWAEPRLLPIRTLARVLMVALGVVAASVVLSLSSDLAQIDLIDRAADGERIRFAEALALDDRAATAGLVYLAAFILSAVAFILWYSRAYANVYALGARDPRFGPGWAIGYWFIPIIAWFRPKQVMNDIWRASDPALDANASGWRENRPTPLLTLWWLVWLGSTLIAFLVSRLLFGSSDLLEPGGTLDGLREAARTAVVFDAVELVSVGLAILVVALTTRRQQARIDRHGSTSAASESDESGSEVESPPPASA